MAAGGDGFGEEDFVVERGGVFRFRGEDIERS